MLKDLFEATSSPWLKKYGPGDIVKDKWGKTHEVMVHNKPMIVTTERKNIHQSHVHLVSRGKPEAVKEAIKGPFRADQSDAVPMPEISRKFKSLAWKENGLAQRRKSFGEIKKKEADDGGALSRAFKKITTGHPNDAAIAKAKKAAETAAASKADPYAKYDPMMKD